MTSPMTSRVTSPDMTAALGPTRGPAILALRCGYCTVGTIEPTMEWQGLAYMQEQVVVGFECENCMAEWDRAGEPVEGPHFASIAVNARRRELDATVGTIPTPATPSTETRVEIP